MVYDADAGMRGELAYVVGKLRGAHCALCDITHATVRRRSSFDELACSLPVEVEVLHRNEQDPDLAAFTAGIEPVVVAHTTGGFEVLMGADDLDACAGSVRRFGEELQRRLAVPSPERRETRSPAPPPH